MKPVYDLLVIAIKFLITVGDLVLLIFSKIFHFITASYSKLSQNFTQIKKNWSKKVSKLLKHYRKIWSQDLASLNASLKTVELAVKKSQRALQSNFKSVNVEAPTIKLPKIDFKFPKLKIGKVKETEIFRAPSYKAPSLSFFSQRLIRLWRTFPRRKRSRGRPRKPFFVPVIFRARYFIFGAIFTFFFVFLPILLFIFIGSLPNPRELVSQDIAQSTKIYDRSGTLLYQIYSNQNRTLVPLSDIPTSLRNATIAIEDKNFYSSSLGFDLLAILRSLIADISGQPLQGGSTITQQLIKSRLLTPEQSIDRKIKELVLAFWAQRIYSKDQILEMYFNQVPYGGTAWGAQEGSQTYFGKDVKDLDLAQSAFLAGLPQAPSIYSPYSTNTNLWKQRQKDVLQKMISLGYINPDQAKDAGRQPLEFEPIAHILHAPYFVMFVKDWLVQKYGLTMVERGGLNVITSLDLKKQTMAEQIVSDEVNGDSYLNIHNGGALITNPKNGDILAMVGGRDYYDQNGGNFNVTQALRQPGSTIKVVTYAAALLNGYTAATQILDAPVAFASAGSPPYAPVNYDGRFHGNLSLRQALGNSINVAAVKTLNNVGVDKMVSLAKDMGITTWKDPSNYGLAITLGAAEVKMTDLAQVYGTFANMGKRVDLNPILKVTDYQGNILEEKNSISEREVIPASVAFIMSNILSDNNARTLEFGSSSPLVIPGHNVSVKTGTSDNKRDNWTIGYTPSYLTTVWVGNNDNSPLNPALASGITGAAPIWHKIMENLLGSVNSSDENYLPPPDVVSKNCLGRVEYFIKGTENTVSCRFVPPVSPKPSP